MEKLELIVSYLMGRDYSYQEAYDEAVELSKYNINQKTLCQQ